MQELYMQWEQYVQWSGKSVGGFFPLKYYVLLKNEDTLDSSQRGVLFFLS